MLTDSYYKEIEPLLLKHFLEREAMVQWLFCPNHLFGYSTPVALILTGDTRPLSWVKQQLEVKKK